jgi:hypothetical protein
VQHAERQGAGTLYFDLFNGAADETEGIRLISERLMAVETIDDAQQLGGEVVLLNSCVLGSTAAAVVGEEDEVGGDDKSVSAVRQSAGGVYLLDGTSLKGVSVFLLADVADCEAQGVPTTPHQIAIIIEIGRRVGGFWG